MSKAGENDCAEIDFKDLYLTTYIEENRTNASSVELCSAARNSMVRLVAEASNSLSNESTCFLLRKQLSEYSQLLHDDSKTDSVNGFSKSIESMLKGKVQTRHCTQWKSNLSSSKFDPASILKENLELSGHCSINQDLPCSNYSPTDEDLSLLCEKKVIPSVEHTLQELLKIQKVPATKSIRTEPKNFQPQNNPQSEMVIKNPVPQTSIKRPREPENYSRQGQFSYKQPAIQNNQFSKNVPQSNARNFEKPPQQNIPTPIETKMAPMDCFKSARDELMIQNKKKYGNPYHNIPQTSENVVQKKSLGTTRSVSNKFIPPLSANNDDKMESEPIQDERLKHIDPKMVELIMSEIIDSSAAIGWEDIAGLEFAKTAIQEAVVWPLLRPDIFTGLRRPPRGILLFGPPGTGKTLIGKCIASQCNATFFSISASSLTSKWIGDGEKMVRALFAVARCHQPAVVFIDEIDSLLTQRSDAEHEATRRIKTEFLVQLDGAAIGDDDRILLIGATNRPQELDEAARRRLVKRLYIPLPVLAARKEIISRLMSSERHSLSESDMNNIAELADGFSGADMRSLCAEAALGPIRSVPLSQISNIESEQVRPVDINDFHNALNRVRPSVSGDDLEQYIKWDKTYGSGSSRF